MAAATLVAVALATACRGDARPREGAPGPLPRPAATEATALAAIVPRLPASPDGAEEVRALDRRIELHRDEPELEIALLLERAWIRGRLDDYTEALARSASWVARAPGERRAWQTRVQVLTRVHDFAAARAALERLRPLVGGPGELAELASGIDEATGAASAAAYRAQRARDTPDPTTLTRWATSLATAGRHDEALAVMRRVPPAIHDNPPELLAWILFQWGRIYELRGEPAAARRFYQASRARLPTIEATVHLAQTTAITGGDPGALVAGALAENPHPELLALAGQIDDARRAWERYVAALPLAFAEHAARFYLGPGRDPARALALAQLDRANRDTDAARTLVAEAALAAGDPALACELAGGLAGGAREARLVAWRAFSACGRADDAARLAAQLGIR
ncbi:MAG TPA: tetratricopeptide repeat protein [Kofleriaceae bacterium]|nr:tetratricopeptide repeat protein [Kofleriaceae bacterium]